jgi:hypothetical protein
MPLQDFIEMPSAAAVSVALEPVQNAIHSLVLLAKAEDISGLSDWVTGTANALTPTERRQHKLVTRAKWVQLSGLRGPPGNRPSPGIARQNAGNLCQNPIFG